MRDVSGFATLVGRQWNSNLIWKLIKCKWKIRGKTSKKNRWTSFSRHFVVTLFNFNALSQQNLWLFTCSIIARRISHRTLSRWSCFRLSFATKDSFPTRTRKEILHFCKLSSKIFHFISIITTPRKCFICPHFPSLRLHLFVIKTQGGKERWNEKRKLLHLLICRP